MCVFGSKSPEVPTPQVAPAPATLQDPLITGARDAEIARNKARQGLGGTRLTTGLGGQGGGMKPLAGGAAQ